MDDRRGICLRSPDLYEGQSPSTQKSGRPTQEPDRFKSSQEAWKEHQNPCAFMPGSLSKEPQPLESMLTIPQVAEVLAICHATVFSLIKYEGLPVTKMGHTTRIPKSKLLRWIEEHMP